MRSVADIFRSYAVLDLAGHHVNGTDKESNHRYGNAYESIIGSTFGPSNGMLGTEGHTAAARANVNLMMEIGVADGSSLLAWREVFPNAHIVGMDIHPSSRANGDRIEFHLGDQANKHDCERAAGGRMFDLIVEDATHHIWNTLLTLYWMWPFIKPGGLYIVEEWANIDRGRITSLWPQAEIVDTVGPFGGNEPLVVFRKPK